MKYHNIQIALCLEVGGWKVVTTIEQYIMIGTRKSRIFEKWTVTLGTANSDLKRWTPVPIFCHYTKRNNRPINILTLYTALFTRKVDYKRVHVHTHNKIIYTCIYTIYSKKHHRPIPAKCETIKLWNVEEISPIFVEWWESQFLLRRKRLS